MTGPRPGRRRTLATLAGAGLLLALVGGEWAARRAGFAAGARLLADAELEYRLMPGRWLGPAGQRVEVNELSMRGGPTSPAPSPGVLRVLVVGDSVVFGGAELDQAELATERLGPLLEAALGRPAEVGNVAAPSWGPPNELAWLRRHGTRGAEVVVVVLSSHDADDAPDFEAIPALDPGYGPAPRSALLEWLRTRLAVRRRAWRPTPSEATLQDARRRCLDATSDLLGLIAAQGARPVLALHRERSELGQPGTPRLEALAARGRAAGVSVVDLGEVYERAVSRGVAPYRDWIHLSAAGQALLAEALARAIQHPLVGGEGR